MYKITKYVMVDIIRNKIVMAYLICLAIISFTVFSMEDNTAKGLLSLLNLILFIVPLVSILFATIYIYNSVEFIELLLSQPLKRRTIWMSLFLGLSLSLCIAFFIGAGIPILIYESSLTGVIMIASACLLSTSFISIAMLAVVYTRDKAKGIGLSLLLWLYFALLFDGFVLFLLFQFSDYPMEKPMIILSLLNPIDLSRIMILLRLDISALMGYSGAVFKLFMGNQLGLVIGLTALVIWTLVPLCISFIKFNRKDL